jgi:hypothetical protein
MVFHNEGGRVDEVLYSPKIKPEHVAGLKIDAEKF